MYLAVDVGGTKTLLAIFKDNGELEAEFKLETPKTYKKFLIEFEKNISTWGKPDFRAAGIAIPGRVERKEGIGLVFGNLTWKNVPIQADIERIINAPVIIENDAKAGALFEALQVKDEFTRVLYIAVGTGIGIGVVNDGVIDTEIGDLGGSSVPVAYQGKKRFWEQIASGKAIVEQFGKRADEIEDETTWIAISHNLAIGVSDLIAITEPDVVIFGGGVSVNFNKFAHFLWLELKKFETPMMQMPPIKQAIKPTEAVIYGAYQLAKQKYG